jgi:glycosyltransferase involved in cell wall biosynthesis
MRGEAYVTIPLPKKSDMRIVYLTHQYFPDHIGGVEVYTRGLAMRMRQLGHEPYIITCRSSLDLPSVREREIDGITVWEIPFDLLDSLHPAHAEYCNSITAAQVHDLLLHLRPDIVHAMHLMNLSGSVLEQCNALAIPFIVTLTDFWPICPRHTLLRWDNNLCYGPRHRFDCVRCVHHTYGFAGHRVQSHPEPLMWLELLGLQALNRSGLLPDLRAIQQRLTYLREEILGAVYIIALSQFQKSMFVRNGYHADRIEVIQHGLEIAGIEMRPSRDPDAPLVVGFIANVTPHKGLHILLDALARCQDAPLELRIYGTLQPSSDYGSQISAQLAQEPRASWKGTFEPDSMGEILRQMHVLAMPALWFENEPLVVKAALFAGIPVLASDLGSLRSMIEHGQAGWLIPAGDVGAWSDALANIESLQPPTCGKPIKTMDENAAEMAHMYEKVLARRSV